MTVQDPLDEAPEEYERDEPVSDAIEEVQNKKEPPAFKENCPDLRNAADDQVRHESPEIVEEAAAAEKVVLVDSLSLQPGLEEEQDPSYFQRDEIPNDDASGSNEEQIENDDPKLKVAELIKVTCALQL